MSKFSAGVNFRQLADDEPEAFHIQAVLRLSTVYRTRKKRLVRTLSAVEEGEVDPIVAKTDTYKYGPGSRV